MITIALHFKISEIQSQTILKKDKLEDVNAINKKVYAQRLLNG